MAIFFTFINSAKIHYKYVTGNLLLNKFQNFNII